MSRCFSLHIFLDIIVKINKKELLSFSKVETENLQQPQFILDYILLSYYKLLFLQSTNIAGSKFSQIEKTKIICQSYPFFQISQDFL